jgi:hypothetical protein
VTYNKHVPCSYYLTSSCFSDHGHLRSASGRGHLRGVAGTEASHPSMGTKAMTPHLCGDGHNVITPLTHWTVYCARRFTSLVTSMTHLLHQGTSILGAWSRPNKRRPSWGGASQEERHLGGVWFLATFCQAKVWLAIKVWQPQKVWLRNWKPNFGKSWQEN